VTAIYNLNAKLKDLSKETLKDSVHLYTINDIINGDDLNVSIENNGIGHYEYWGQKAFDKGYTYLTLDDPDVFNINITFETLPEGTKAEDIVKMLNEQLDVRKTITKAVPRKAARDEEDIYELKLKINFKNPSLEGNFFKTSACWEKLK
jgi:hypothetical protein